MSDLPKYLILLFVVVTSALIGRIVWEMVAPPMTELLAAVPSLLGAVPGWIWWVAFGVSMSMICRLKHCFLARTCRAS